MKVISKPEHGPFNIFISYSHHDERLARTIGDLLRYRVNTRVFLDSEISAGGTGNLSCENN